MQTFSTQSIIMVKLKIDCLIHNNKFKFAHLFTLILNCKLFSQKHAVCMNNTNFITR